jgi:hypothetical protein
MKEFLCHLLNVQEVNHVSQIKIHTANTLTVFWRLLLTKNRRIMFKDKLLIFKDKNPTTGQEISPETARPA